MKGKDSTQITKAEQAAIRCLRTLQQLRGLDITVLSTDVAAIETVLKLIERQNPGSTKQGATHAEKPSHVKVGQNRASEGSRHEAYSGGRDSKA